MWLVAINGLALVAIGVWLGVSQPSGWLGALVAIAFGLALLFAVWSGRRSQRQNAQLREGYASVNANGAKLNQRVRWLLWAQWGAFGLMFVVIFATARSGFPWTIPLLISIGVLWVAIMLYRAFIEQNLTDAAMRKMSGEPEGRTWWRRNIGGAIVVLMVLVVFALAAIDTWGMLPFKLMDWVLGFLLVAFVVTIMAVAGAWLWERLKRR